MTAVIIFLFIVYYLFMAVLLVGWNKASHRPERESSETACNTFITVVIAVRNEEHIIQFLLDDLTKQKYKSFEVIIVDDQSEDKTRSIVDDYVKKDNRFFLERSSGTGKKQALTAGIKAARGSVIVTTDADCTVSDYWLEGLSRYFSNERVKMVFGGVRMKTSSFFSHLQALEFLSLIGSGAAMAGIRLPIMCNGANLAFRKSTFDEVGGYKGNFHIPSGDDEFLMRKILSRYPRGVEFAPVRNSIVTTDTTHSLLAFLNQRIRWAGKWKANQSFTSKVLALFILSFQICILFLPVFVLTNTIDPWIALSLWLLKVILEFIFLRSMGRFFSVPWHWMPFLFLQFIYPAYVVLIGIFSNFRSFEWKGRKLKSLMVSRY
ncbi:MAG: hypothetical protein C0490_01970 [Marivirga sp.]|nr:hypothetical protein [Marivirga sp.]